MGDEMQLYFNGNIYTVDDDRPAAEAVAVAGGKIAAVGTEAECRAALGDGVEEIDLEGRTMLPGFFDTHLHLVMFIYFSLNVNLRDTASMIDFETRLRAAKPGGPGSWVVGLNFNEQTMDIPRVPDRHDLDRVVADRPLIVIKHDGHSIIANTKAINAAGADASTPDPDGGGIDREPDGFPAGAFRENAMAMLTKHIQIPDIDDLLAAARESFEKLASYGITSIGTIYQTDETGPEGAAGVFDLPLMQMLTPQSPINLYGMIITDDVKKIEQARATPLHSDTPGGHRIGALKMFADGSFGSSTSFMSEPFTDQPGNRGMMTRTDEEIYRQMESAHRAGLQIAIHVIGDAAMRKVVDIFDRLLGEYPRDDHRHRIEHASLVDAEIIDDIRRLGLVVSSQPMFIHTEKGYLEKRLGPERIKWTYAYRSMLDAGIRLAGASDAPVEEPDVLQAIQCCVTREGIAPEQAITAAEAVRMFTIDSAFAQFEEDVKGSITPGKRADFVVLDRSPMETPPDEISGIRVLKTICGGKTIYSA